MCRRGRGYGASPFGAKSERVGAGAAFGGDVCSQDATALISGRPMVRRVSRGLALCFSRLTSAEIRAADDGGFIAGPIPKVD